MLQDDQTMATEVTRMARGHFNKLAALAVKVQGARELGTLAAHSSLGDDMIPMEFTIEKMAANWARRRALHSISIDFEKTSSADLEKLAALAYDELGEAHMEKLAEGILSGDITWDELSDMEKVALNLGGLWKGVKNVGRSVAGMGRKIDLPGAPKVPGQGGGFMQKMKDFGSSLTGKGKTVRGPSAAQEAMEDVAKIRAEGTGTAARQLPGGSGTGTRQVPKTQAQPGQAPYRQAAGEAPPPPPPPAPKHTQGTGAQATQTGAAGAQGQPPAPPSAPGKPKPGFWNWKTKLMLGTTAASIPATYLGGKALDTTKQFLTPQPPGTSYQYGGGSPSHFMNPQMGM